MEAKESLFLMPEEGASEASNAAAPVAGTMLGLFSSQHDQGDGQATSNDLDIDDLFHDFYYEDFPMPTPVTSMESTLQPTAQQIPTQPSTAGGEKRKADIDEEDLRTELALSSMSDTKELTEAQKVERRERNREHAKRSRLRKKFLLESLQEQIHGLQGEIEYLKNIIKTEIPEKADGLLSGNDGTKNKSYTPFPMPSGFGPVKTLIEPDFRLMSSLSGSQQNFAIADPSLPDNPIVYCSQGFLELTGYALDQVLGRNCRILQGPGTDQKTVEIIRNGIRDGVDTSVCLLNYKADGTPFWNQFFVAALRDAQNNIVNYVGVQCEVSKAVVESKMSKKGGIKAS